MECRENNYIHRRKERGERECREERNPENHRSLEPHSQKGLNPSHCAAEDRETEAQRPKGAELRPNSGAWPLKNINGLLRWMAAGGGQDGEGTLETKAWLRAETEPAGGPQPLS